MRAILKQRYLSILPKVHEDVEFRSSGGGTSGPLAGAWEFRAVEDTVGTETYRKGSSLVDKIVPLSFHVVDKGIISFVKGM